MQPKIHKEGNPGRPVFSSVNCRSTKILQYVHHHLQLYFQELEYYVKDSIDFVKKLSTTDKVPQKSFLVTMDVRSLYTNMPITKELQQLKQH